MTSLAPIFSSPCDLAARLPLMVADFLDIEQRLKRRFREDSITDIIVASMLSLPGDDVVVVTPSERKTGGDFDLVLTDATSRDAVQFRIQAKRLTPHPGDWRMGSYRELAHPHNTGAQSGKLVSRLSLEPVETIPLYAFYNPASTCEASQGLVSGIELAGGQAVRELIKMMVRVKPKRLPFKRLGQLQPLLFPLSTILCPPADPASRLRVPPPALVRATVERAIAARGAEGSTDERGAAEHAQSDRIAGRSTLAQKARVRAPVVLRAALQRRGERIVRARVPRPMVIMISDDT